MGWTRSALLAVLLIPLLPVAGALERCEEDFARFHAAVERAGAEAAHPRAVAGFPWLRADRFLASFAGELTGADARRAWMRRLADLAAQARDIERALLPEGAMVPDEARLHPCATRLIERDLLHSDRMAAVAAAVTIPDDYEDAWRALGVYPLSALGVRLGIRNLHRETLDTFRQPLSTLPVAGTLRRYVPPEPVGRPARIRSDALGVPNPDPAELERLLKWHAPVWEVDTAGFDDRPGQPYWGGAARPAVDPAEAVVYHYVDHARLDGRVLLQLVYQVWFNARPRESGLDIRGGMLDGLVWRVTVDRDGRALMYDSIHPCGCYHLWFPGHGLRLRRSAHSLPEPPLAPQAAPVPRRDERVVLRVASGTHYLQRVYADLPGAGTSYRLAPYAELYRLVDVTTSGVRSLFGPDGLVEGTERAERWLLWPMGIREPGAMRERGHQPTAFVGRRHFDDPLLIETLFEVMP